jgi:hypothetical protein
MKTVIIVSRCLKVIKINREESWYEFHFKGVCAGEVLKKVILKGRHDFHLLKDQEYLLYVKIMSIEGGLLRGLILKSKLLEECWNQA